jgi:non-ribosomal peptide synthetase component F
MLPLPGEWSGFVRRYDYPEQMMAHGIGIRELDFGSSAGSAGFHDLMATPTTVAAQEGSEHQSMPSPVLTAPGGEPRAGAGDRLELLFEETARRFEARDAVVTDDRVWSYREIDERANQVARVLIGAGVRPGDRIGLLLDRTVETYVGLLAVMKAKAAWVPLATAFPAERIAYILEDAAISMVVSISLF